MNSSTIAIVLRCIKYNDNYNIVDLLTRDLGRCSVLVPLARNKKRSKYAMFFQPLFLLDISLFRKGNKGLYKVKDVQFNTPFSSIPYNPYKISMVFFLAEVIYYISPEEEPDNSLFDFIYHSITWLDQSIESYSNFHIVFLIKILFFLGIYPNMSNYHPGVCFDMLNASFVKTPPQDHGYYMKGDLTEKMVLLARMNFDTMHLFKLSQNDRREIISFLSEYYKLHIPSVPELKSLSILKDLFG